MSGSSAESATVCTVYVTEVVFAAIVTAPFLAPVAAGGRTWPPSPTSRLMGRLAAGAGSASIVKVIAVPSVTLLVCELMVIAGSSTKLKTGESP